MRPRAVCDRKNLIVVVVEMLCSSEFFGVDWRVAVLGKAV